MSDMDKDMEILALRSQLSLIQQQILNHKMPKPRFTPAYRQLWVLLSKVFSDWKSALFLVKPKTVIGWHKNAFKLYWKRKSRKTGRPKISPEIIALIKQIHKENPLLSPEKIHERLINLSRTCLRQTPLQNIYPIYENHQLKNSSNRGKLFSKITVKELGQWTLWLFRLLHLRSCMFC